MAVNITRVYTRTGDRGETGLVGGKRVSKAHGRIQACGNIDELSCAIGCAKEKLTPSTEELRSVLETIQQELFDIGAEIATPTNKNVAEMWQTSEKEVSRLEQLCDCYNEALEPLRSFILPGGSELAAFLHLSRAICRRGERVVVELCENNECDETLNSKVIEYLNRLSDLLFILCRWVLMKDNIDPPLWIPAKQR